MLSGYEIIRYGLPACSPETRCLISSVTAGLRLRGRGAGDKGREIIMFELRILCGSARRNWHAAARYCAATLRFKIDNISRVRMRACAYG